MPLSAPHQQHTTPEQRSHRDTGERRYPSRRSQTRRTQPPLYCSDAGRRATHTRRHTHRRVRCCTVELHVRKLGDVPSQGSRQCDLVQRRQQLAQRREASTEQCSHHQAEAAPRQLPQPLVLRRHGPRSRHTPPTQPRHLRTQQRCQFRPQQPMYQLWRGTRRPASRWRTRTGAKLPRAPTHPTQPLPCVRGPQPHQQWQLLHLGDGPRHRVRIRYPHHSDPADTAAQARHPRLVIEPGGCCGDPSRCHRRLGLPPQPVLRQAPSCATSGDGIPPDTTQTDTCGTATQLLARHGARRELIQIACCPWMLRSAHRTATLGEAQWLLPTADSRQQGRPCRRCH